MVELFLVEEDENGYFTEFWGSRHSWPDDVVSDRGVLPVASPAAVSGYRAVHPALPKVASHA